MQRPHASYSSRILGTTVHALFERATSLLARGLPHAELHAALPEFRLKANALARNGGLSQLEAVVVANNAVHAIEKALGNAKKSLIHDHIDHCLELQADASAQAAKSAIKEFKELSKYL